MTNDAIVEQFHSTLPNNQPLTLMEALITGTGKLSQEADISMLSLLKEEIQKLYGFRGIRITIARMPLKIIVVQVGYPARRELILESPKWYYDINEDLMQKIIDEFNKP
jgi:hypothetical protein